MSSAASANSTTLQAGILEARDARQRVLVAALAKARTGNQVSVLFVSTNIPGPDKHRPGSSALIVGALDSLQKTIPLESDALESDLLGPFWIGYSTTQPAKIKQRTIEIEAAHPSARLLDIDVYGLDGIQISRVMLGATPRACLICSEPAGECIRLGRHQPQEIQPRVETLLESFQTVHKTLTLERLAENLALGAHLELRVTPKPGLVDSHDNGSHADLTYATMQTSANLLPMYFADLLNGFQQGVPLQTYVQAGLEAEARMFTAIHSNAHKGYIFLSGLLLLAACECEGEIARLRTTLANLAGRFFAGFDSSKSTSVRLRHTVGGIQAATERGLPAVFDHGWPRYQEVLSEGWGKEDAAFYLMAILMHQVEDTTAIHRCGVDGLARLQRDGANLQRMLERRQSPQNWLAELNEDYRRIGLTMGGVADCMALVFALHLSFAPPKP
ncbi:MAG: triphosphoribosyl-dephospho-CoA synthase [Holophaga sp.]|nr:triphosphoribosyl-dephospho-CoA synthase [Holophaga sp.]